jgi:hypothetical protein
MQVGPDGELLYKNTWSAIKTIWKNESITAFGKGVGPRLLSTTVFSSIGALVYEKVVEISRKNPENYELKHIIENEQKKK